MLAESGIQGQLVLVGLVESEFCLSQVACVLIPVAFGFVRLNFIVEFISRRAAAQEILYGDLIRIFVLKIISGW